MHLHPVMTRVSSCFIVIFGGHFPQKSLIMSGSFAENDLQLKSSSCNDMRLIMSYNDLCTSFSAKEPYT